MLRLCVLGCVNANSLWSMFVVEIWKTRTLYVTACLPNVSDDGSCSVEQVFRQRVWLSSLKPNSLCLCLSALRSSVCNDGIVSGVQDSRQSHRFVVCLLIVYTHRIARCSDILTQFQYRVAFGSCIWRKIWCCCATAISIAFDKSTEAFNDCLRLQRFCTKYFAIFSYFTTVFIRLN